MPKPQEIIFNNPVYGSCTLKPSFNIENFRLVFQDPDIHHLTSIGDSRNRTVSEERLQRMFKRSEYEHENYGVGLYEIYSEENIFLGITGFFCSTASNTLEIERATYLLTAHQNKGLTSSMLVPVTQHAFTVTRCKRILVDAFPENISTKIFTKIGFCKRTDVAPYPKGRPQYGQIQYELTRQVFGLYILSQLLKTQREKLRQKPWDLAGANMERVRRLWFKNFGKGISLAEGGVKDSFLTLSQLKTRARENIEKFNGYRSDRPESVVLNQSRILNFLVEEDILSAEYVGQMHASFSLGAHEGFCRLVRCLYSLERREMLFPEGCYGFLAVAANHMRPRNLNVSLVKTDIEFSGKIKLDDLKRQIFKHPFAKILFIEFKPICGSVYSESEIRDIAKICKARNIFLILDIAHHNIFLQSDVKLPNVSAIFHELRFTQFAILVTMSKVYGLERARVGFIVTHKQNTIENNWHETLDLEVYRLLGSGNDLPFEVAHALIYTDKTARRQYYEKYARVYRFNMNVMLAYIEGIDSSRIDTDLYANVVAEIPAKYSSGIPLRVVYKPECGFHMRIDMSGLAKKFLGNFQLYNAELFSYALNACMGVVTLHASQIMDAGKYSMRLSFISLENIHNAMQRMHDFISYLSDTPQPNPFMPGILEVNKLISLSEEEITDHIRDSRERAVAFRKDAEKNFNRYRKQFCRNHPLFSPADPKVSESVHEAARKIQSQFRFWKRLKIDKPETSDCCIILRSRL